MFVFVIPTMNMKFVRGFGAKFLKFNEHVPMVLPVRDSTYSFLLYNYSSSIISSNQILESLDISVRGRNVKFMVLLLYRSIRPRPEILKERYFNLFTSSRFDKYINRVIDITEVNVIVEDHIVFLDYYHIHTMYPFICCRREPSCWTIGPNLPHIYAPTLFIHHFISLWIPKWSK